MRIVACVGVIGLGLIAAMASAACSSKSDSGNTGTTGGDSGTPEASTQSDGGGGAEWIIGVSDSLTGPLQGIGTPLQNSVKVAEANINANGGILGKPVRFIIEDDTSDESDIARQTIGKLISQGAAAIIGPNGSGQVNAVQTATYASKLIEISATATSPVLTTVQPAQDRYLFRTVPADDFQGKALVKFAISGPSGNGAGGAGDAGADGGGTGGAACKKLALFYYTNPYGTAMAKVVKDNFPAASGGGSIVADVSVDTAVKSDYNTEVGTLVAAKPDCLAMIVYDDVGDVFLSSLQQALNVPVGGGWSAPWNSNFFVIGTDGSYTQALIDNGRSDKSNPNSPTVAEGVYGTNPDTNPLTSDYNDFKNLYVAQYPLAPGKTDLDAYTANQFDAATLIALAIAQAGGTSDKVALRDALYKVSSGGKAHGPGDILGALADISHGIDIDYRGASGPVDFDPYGNVTGGYIIWHVKNGKFDVIARYKASDVE